MDRISGSPLRQSVSTCQRTAAYSYPPTRAGAAVWSRRFAATLAIIVAALGGCASPNTATPEVDTSELVWPVPPEQPRIRYLRSISSKDDIGASADRSFASMILGEEKKPAAERLQKPFEVHADRVGRIFVADTGHGKLVVFDVANKKYELWGEGGKGALKQPLGVTSDSEGRIYVTDGIQQRVVIYDREGNFVRAAGRKGELERPVGIVVNERLGRIYVADVKAHHIAVFDMQGNFLSAIGGRGTQPGQFNFPTSLAIDRVGNLYVVDAMNFRVQILSPDGNPLKSIGQMGTGPGNFSRPKGIAVDTDGHIYVVDAAFNNFQIFDAEGRLLLYVGEIGQGPGQFWLPAGAYIDAQDRIYVADQYNYRVQMFQYLGDRARQGGSAASDESSDVQEAESSTQ